MEQIYQKFSEIETLSVRVAFNHPRMKKLYGPPRKNCAASPDCFDYRLVSIVPMIGKGGFSIVLFFPHSLITRDAINSHFEIAKRKGNDALAIFKRNFEDPLLFSINLAAKKIDFKF